MTNKERMLAVINGTPKDRTPFVTNPNNAAPDEEIWAAYGKDRVAMLRGTYIHKIVNDDAKLINENIMIDGREGIRKSIITSKGTLYEEHTKVYVLNTYAMTKHYVETKADLEILLHYLKNSRVIPYFEYFWNNYNEVGDDGIVNVCVERTPFQQMWIIWANLMDFSYLWLDCEDLVEECMTEIGRLLREQFKVIGSGIKELPISIVEFPENMTTPCIGRENYKKYCMPYYKELKDIIGNTMLGIHADGDTKGLADLINKSGINFLESFTPAPDNDVSIEDAVKLYPNMAFFINFTSSVHLCSEEEIYNTAMNIMKICEGRKMWIQITESVPPGVWKKSFPQIMRAVEQFK